MTVGFSAVRHLAPSSPCLICASCSSGRKFASSFLQTPPRGGCPCCSAWSSRHQGLQRTFTSKSLPGSVSLTGSQTTCSMHVASRHARRTDRRAPARHPPSGVIRLRHGEVVRRLPIHALCVQIALVNQSSRSRFPSPAGRKSPAGRRPATTTSVGSCRPGVSPTLRDAPSVFARSRSAPAFVQAD